MAKPRSRRDALDARCTPARPTLHTGSRDTDGLVRGDAFLCLLLIKAGQICRASVDCEGLLKKEHRTHASMLHYVWTFIEQLCGGECREVASMHEAMHAFARERIEPGFEFSGSGFSGDHFSPKVAPGNM